MDKDQEAANVCTGQVGAETEEGFDVEKVEVDVDNDEHGSDPCSNPNPGHPGAAGVFGATESESTEPEVQTNMEGALNLVVPDSEEFESFLDTLASVCASAPSMPLPLREPEGAVANVGVCVGENDNNQLTPEANAIYYATATDIDNLMTCHLHAGGGGGGEEVDEVLLSEAEAEAQDEGTGAEWQRQISNMDQQLKDVEELQPPPNRWKDVAYTAKNSCKVAHYYNLTDQLITLPPDTDVSGMAEFTLSKVLLGPDTVYKFRVAGVNGCGIGPFSEEVTIRTPRAGLPPPPESISVVLETNAVRIGWRPGSEGNGRPNVATPTFVVVDPSIEYLVYMAVDQPGSQSQRHGLQFAQVYCGKETYCRVPNSVMKSARIDVSDGTKKPAIIFRIKAKNKLGDGPSTQVRWIIDDYDKDCRQAPAGKGKRKHGAKGLGSGKTMEKEKSAERQKMGTFDSAVDVFKRPTAPAKRSFKQMAGPSPPPAREPAPTDVPPGE